MVQDCTAQARRSGRLTESGPPTPAPVVVVFGASGFVGRGLLEPLSRTAHAVRCVSRDPSRLELPTRGNALPISADLLVESSLPRVLRGADVVYYLAHALAEPESFADLEAEAAANFARAVAGSGVRRIVYLGALAQVVDSGDASDHVSSRRRVGEILRASGVPVTELRASVAIGAGSMPFEVVRALVERLPVMVTPRWTRMPIQPIAQADLVAYLLEAGKERGTASHVYEIGGDSVVDYAELMRAYGRARGLRRLMIRVPVITPRLSSLWLKLVTPAHFRMGRRIVDSASHASVVADRAALDAFPIRPVGVDRAVRDALREEGEAIARLPLADPAAPTASRRRRVGTHFLEYRAALVPADPGACFRVVNAIGGRTGWYWGNALWRFRGALDRLVGGPGMRAAATADRPRAVGDIVDFWTVEACDGASHLRLRADMRLPGEARLDLRVRSLEAGEGCRIEQTVSFDARGVFGIVYWYALYPIHVLVFERMLRGMARAAMGSGTPTRRRRPPRFAAPARP